MILFGTAALAYPDETFFVLVLVFAAACLVDGVVNLALAAQRARAAARWKLAALHGLIAVAIGGSIFVWPHITAAVLVALVAAWSIFSGALMLDLAFCFASGSGRWFLLAVGAWNAWFGLFLLLAPVLGVIVLVWWIGVNAIFFGTALVATAYALAITGDDLSRGRNAEV